MDLSTLHRIRDPQGKWILAWGCGCGQKPESPMAVIRLDESKMGVRYLWSHVDCLEKVEDE